MKNDRKKRRGLRSEVAVPVNLERLLLKAAEDPLFEAALLENPMAALERFGVRATGSEKMMLNTMRPQMLRVMIERLKDKPRISSKASGFAGAVAAAALAGGMFVASCDSGNDMALDGGSSPDIDTDTDGDVDTDSDADTDADTDTDTDTGVEPDGGADGGDGGS